MYRSRRSAPLVCDEVGHGLGRLVSCLSRARAARRRRLANQATGAQILQRVDLVHGNQACDATAAHGHDHLAAVLDVLDVAAEPVVQLADADLRLQRFAMWRHDYQVYALHQACERSAQSDELTGGARVR